MSERSLTELAASVLERAVAAGATAAEGYAEDSTGREIRVWGGEVESLTESAQRGLGVRAWLEGRVGYSYGTDLAEAGIEEIVASAVEAARAADPDEHAAAPEGGEAAPELDGIVDVSIDEWPTVDKVELALAAERAALGAEGVSNVEQTIYSEESSSVAIATSAGTSGAYRSTIAYAYLQAHAGEQDGVESGLGFGVARGPAELDPEAIGGEAAGRASSMLGATKPASRAAPVLLDPTVAASLIGLIGGTLSADAVQRGRSPFAGRLGTRVGSESLDLLDDGLAEGGLASAPFDAEGVPHRRTSLIAGGELKTFLYDTYTARRDGESSTGNASRSGYRSPPTVSPSNLLVAEGERSFDELLVDADGGIYITDVTGLHSGVNPVSGTLSVGASGIEISGGELGEPVSEFTIGSDLISMLEGVRATASEARWVPFGGSVRTPAILIGEMAISGT